MRANRAGQAPAAAIVLGLLVAVLLSWVVRERPSEAPDAPPVQVRYVSDIRSALAQPAPPRDVQLGRTADELAYDPAKGWTRGGSTVPRRDLPEELRKAYGAEEYPDGGRPAEPMERSHGEPVTAEGPWTLNKELVR